MGAVIWWIRRDLRLADNPALQAALARGVPVIPLFVVDPALWRPSGVGARRLAFLRAGLHSLDAALRQRGSQLHVRIGDPAEVLPQALGEIDARAIYAETDFSPLARARDARVAAAVPLQRVHGLTVQPPGAILTSAGAPYRIFTPFARAWRKGIQGSDLRPQPAPASLLAPPAFASETLPGAGEAPVDFTFSPGEAEAQARLAKFAKGSGAPIFHYAERRDRLDLNGTAGISVYLRFGMLSARQAVAAALRAISAAPGAAAEAGAQAWLNELIWREFYVHLLHHYPELLRGSLRPEWGRIRWRDDQGDFAAWCEGRTGYPIVDAAMRQLRATGWIHNRTRMIAASFLVKDLLIDWRRGERWFMRQLLDAEPASNNGGWQWVAGTGTDAAPYFRIFNPTAQAKKFDPQGDYTRRWVPELRGVADRYLHEPARMPASLQQQLGIHLGETYPHPVVDHARARTRALAAYRAARIASTGRGR